MYAYPSRSVLLSADHTALSYQQPPKPPNLFKEPGVNTIDDCFGECAI
jgi:hypothetical protein